MQSKTVDNTESMKDAKLSATAANANASNDVVSGFKAETLVDFKNETEILVSNIQICSKLCQQVAQTS